MPPTRQNYGLTNMLKLPELQALETLNYDGRLLLGTRLVRMFAYGCLSVVLALYLTEVGLSEREIGLLLTATLIGDAALSLFIASIADRLGRKRMLIAGVGLMVFAGMIFVATTNIGLLVMAAVVGTLSPTGNEVGAFLSIEQASLPQTTRNEYRTPVYAWYNLLGSVATASGALTGGVLAEVLQQQGRSALDSYRVVILLYTLLGVLLGFLFTRLSETIETPRYGKRRDEVQPTVNSFLGLHRSHSVVMRLAGLFMVDAFAGGLVLQSLLAYWFKVKYGVNPAVLGSIFFGANILAGLSALAAVRMAARYGLINTMVFTHIPSNILLMLVPLMPNLPLAIGLLLVRFSISQMDVPTRQSYMMAIVEPDERSAAAGLTTVARTGASAIAPTFTGIMFNASLLSLPFFLAGMLKIIYDLSLYRSFRALKPPEEN